MTIQEFFAEGKIKQIKNIQITEKTKNESNVYFINGKMKDYQDTFNIHYHIKGEYKGKTVEVSTNYLSSDILDLIIKKCLVTESSYEDEYLNNIENIPKNKPHEFYILDIIKKLRELDYIRKEYPLVKDLSFIYEENYTNTRIVNSNGVDISTDNHLCTFSVDAVVENNKEYTSFDDKVLTTNREEIDFYGITENVIQKLLILSKKEKIVTNKYALLIDRRVMSRLLSSFGDMLAASKIRNKVSCLEDKLNQKLFSSKLTVIEDPTNEKYPGYRLFDEEGTKTSKKCVVEKGVLKTYFYNIKEAKLASSKSTGNGYQGSIFRNFYVSPGNKNIDVLLKELDNGIYIVDYMSSGGTTVNSVNGDISLQVFGFIVQDGKLVSGIEPCILTTTIFELFSNIQEIGNDLVFMNQTSASPSWLVKDISLAR